MDCVASPCWLHVDSSPQIHLHVHNCISTVLQLKSFSPCPASFLFFSAGISHCNPLSAVCRKSITSGSVPSQDLGLASTASFGPPPKSADSRVTLVLNYTYPLNSDSGCPKIYSSIQFVCNRTASLNVSTWYMCTYTCMYYAVDQSFAWILGIYENSIFMYM